MKITSNGSIVIALLLSSLLSSLAQAQTSWKGTVSSSWGTAANWTAGVPSAAVDAIVGDGNFTGANQPSAGVKSACKSLTIGTGAKVSVLTISHAFTVGGNITIGANGTINHSSKKPISLTGNWSNVGIYNPTDNRAPVTFSGAIQSIGGLPTTFNQLNINAGSTTILNANVTVANQLRVSGTLDPGESPTFTVSGNGKLNLGTGGTLLVKASTFAGNYALTGAKTISASSTVDYAAVAANQAVANSLTYSTLRISGGLTKTLAGNLPSLSGNIVVAAGTLDLSTFTANRASAGGTLSVANGTTLRIGGTQTFPANYQTHSLGFSSTVEYSGTSQVVTAESYGNLTLSSSGGAVVKTMPASAMTIAGNLTTTAGAGTSVSCTAGAAITVQGNVSIGPSTTVNGGSFALSVGGNWTNNGTFTGATGSLTLSGTGALISGNGANNFNNLVISGGGVNAAASTSLAIAGNLTTSGVGDFTHLSPGPGSVTMSGAARNINGLGITLNHLVISGSTTVGGSLAISGNLSVTGTLNAAAGTITMTGPANTISGGGLITFNGLDIRGGISAAVNLSIKSDLSVSGTFTASAGTVSFIGTSTLSGAPNLFNVTLNGTKLQLGASAGLGIGGAFAITAGTFDTSTTTPNSVNYNAATSQTILAVTYDNLRLSGGGTKTAVGPVTLLGDLFIGSGTSFSAGSFTHLIFGNWINNGSFVPGSSTIQLQGGSDTAISGPTTFVTLSVNKGAANTVTLNNNVGVSLLNMTSGTMLTGTNSVTITTDRTGNGIILGTIVRTHAFAAGIPYAFEGPNNTIDFSTLAAVSSVTVQVAKGSVSDFPFGAAINRQYVINLTAGGPYTATLRLHYENSELNGNLEAALQLLLFVPPWTVSGVTARDGANNWVEQSGLTDVTGRWAVSDNPKVAAWNGSVSSVWETAGNWTALAGSPTIPPGTNELAAIGTQGFVNQPGISSAVSVRGLFFGSVQPSTLTIGPGGSLATLGNISGNWDAAASHSIVVGAQALTVGGDFQMSDGTNGHSINLTLASGSVSVSGSLTESGDANLAISGPGALQIGGDFNNAGGIFNAGSGTVIYNGAAAQRVAGNIAYSHLAFAKPSGTATLTNTASVSGNLVLTNNSVFLVNAPLGLSNNVTINPNSTLDGGNSTIVVGGNWTNSGTFIPETGTVVFSGTNSQNISATTFNNLTVNKSTNTVTLTGNLVINADLNVAAGKLDLATFTANRSVMGGTFTLAANTLLRVGTGSGFPSNFDTANLAGTSTVEYYGSGTQVVTAQTYGNLSFSNGGGSAKTLAGDCSVAGDLVINSGATLDASLFSLSLHGNWTNNGLFTASSSSVSLNGSARNLSGATTFKDLSVIGSYTAFGDITVNGKMNVSGTYGAGPRSCTFGGDFANAGTFSSSGTITFAGTGPQTLALNSGFNSSGTVNFNGSVAPIFNSSNPSIFRNITINNSGGVAPDLGWIVQGAFVVNSGAFFNGGSTTHTFDGDFSNFGTVTSSGTIVFNPASPVSLTLGGATFSSTTVLFGGVGQITFGAGAQPFGSVTITNGYAAGVTLGANWTLSGDLLVGPATTVNGGVALTHSISGDFSQNGIFNGGTSTVILTGAADPLNGGSIAGIGATTFNHLILNGTITANSSFNVAGNFTNNGLFDGTGSIITFTGNAPSVLGGITTPTPFDSLVIAKNAAVATLAVNLSGLTSLTISGGTLDAATFTIAQNGLGGALTINAGATLRISGANTLPGFNSYSFDPASTVEYYGAGTQMIAPVNYGNLLSSSTGGRILSSGATVGIAGTFVPGANAYTINNSTINYNGTSAQIIAAFNYYHLTSSSSGARVLAPSGTIGVAGTFVPGSNGYTVTGSTLNFNGAAQNIPLFTYNNLSVTGSGTKTLTGNATVDGALDLETGTLADGGFTLTAQGDVINQGLHSGTGEILLASGAASHNLFGGGSYANLELNDSNGASAVQTNLTVNGTLIFTSGLITTTTNIVIIGPAGQVTRTSGHVVGNLRKSVGSGPSVTNTFEIGAVTNYSPVTIVLSNVTTPGNLTAHVTAGDHPAITNSGITTTRSVNEYWTLTNNGTAFGSYKATFNFPAATIDPAANPSNFIVAKLDGIKWTLPAIGARTASSIQALGMTNFSDFVLGEPLPASAPTITLQPQGQRANQGSSATFNVTATGTGTLTYQWRLNGSPLASATSSTLTILNIQDANAGNYSVIVDNGLSTTSSNALLTINHPPTFAPILDQTISALSTLTVPTSASDPDGGVLTYSLLAGPQGVSISASGVITWTPTAAQGPSANTISVQVADDGAPALTGTTSFLVVVTGPYQGIDLTDPTQALADADGDGLSNLLEFALGSDPHNPADVSSGMVVFVVQDSGNSFVALRFKRRTNAAALPLQYLPEISGDNQTWYSDGAHLLQVSVIPVDAQFDWVTVRDLTPLPSNVVRFMRLRVVAN